MERKQIRTASNIIVTFTEVDEDRVKIVGIECNGKDVEKVSYPVESRHPGGYGSVPHRLKHNAVIRVGDVQYRGYAFSWDAEAEAA